MGHCRTNGLSLNVKRRNLTKSQTAIAAAQARDFADSRKVAGKQGRADALAATFEVSARYIQQARAVVDRAPDLADGRLPRRDQTPEGRHRELGLGLLPKHPERRRGELDLDEPGPGLGAESLKPSARCPREPEILVASHEPDELEGVPERDVREVVGVDERGGQVAGRESLREPTMFGPGDAHRTDVRTASGFTVEVAEHPLDELAVLADAGQRELEVAFAIERRQRGGVGLDQDLRHGLEIEGLDVQLVPVLGKVSHRERDRHGGSNRLAARRPGESDARPRDPRRPLHLSVPADRVALRKCPRDAQTSGGVASKGSPSTRSAIYLPSSPDSVPFRTRRRPTWPK